MLRLSRCPFRAALPFWFCAWPRFDGLWRCAGRRPRSPAAPELRVFDPSLIDKTVDPCENFYRFSCNGWFKRNPLPADQTSYGRFTELQS